MESLTAECDDVDDAPMYLSFAQFAAAQRGQLAEARARAHAEIEFAFDRQAARLEAELAMAARDHFGIDSH